MIRKELEQKYGKKLIDRIFKEGHLEGCTIIIRPDGKDDIPESDILRAIKEINGEKAQDWD